MKKLIALLLASVMVFAFAACSSEEDINAKSEGVMTYAEYAAAELETEVTIEAYVQAKQSWWDNKATLYTQDGEGAYFIYNAAMSEEDYNKIAIGQKIRVKGFKTAWAGEVEVAEGAAVEILEGSYIAEATDATALLGTDALINSQNMFVAFKDMTVEASTDANGKEAAFLYNWDGSGAAGTDSDLYFKASANGQTYTFVVEYYLTNETTEVYQAVSNLKVGDKIDMEGFLYWYEGVQPHITSVVVK